MLIIIRSSSPHCRSKKAAQKTKTATDLVAAAGLNFYAALSDDCLIAHTIRPRRSGIEPVAVSKRVAKSNGVHEMVALYGLQSYAKRPAMSIWLD
jgi:hypothetical protein